jgi:hypothetical protein
MIWRLCLEIFFLLLTESWCVVHWSPQVKGKGERSIVQRCEKEFHNCQCDHAVCMCLLWKWTVFECDQRCIHSTDSVEKSKWNENGGKHTWICQRETLVCNCRTNDYILEQLDAGQSVQGSIECVTVCHLDYSNIYLDLWTYIVTFHS